MIGNAVPVDMANILANKILLDLKSLKKVKNVALKTQTSSKITGNIVRERMNELVNQSV